VTERTEPASKASPGVAARILAGVCITLLVVFVGMALSQGLLPAAADARSLKARAETELWRAGVAKKFPSDVRWERVRDNLSRARDLVPSNPQFYDQLGFVNSYRAMGLPPVKENLDLKRIQFKAAADHYRQATSLRPMFPYSWAHLALAHHYTLIWTPMAPGSAIELEMWEAFDKAFAYGRNEYGVQRILAEIAFGRWAALEPGRAKGIRAMIDANPASVQRPLLAMAEYFGIPIYIDADP
jgi:hypothetical protein